MCVCKRIKEVKKVIDNKEARKKKLKQRKGVKSKNKNKAKKIVQMSALKWLANIDEKNTTIYRYESVRCLHYVMRAHTLVQCK